MGSSRGVLRAFGAFVCALVLGSGMLWARVGSAQTPTATPTPGGDCCAAHQGPSCDVGACADCVCGNDPVCCLATGSWDQFCVADTKDATCTAACRCEQTPSPTPTPGGPCCEPRTSGSGGTGCDDATCQSCVCGIDPDCCNLEWDATCASEAMVECLTSCPCLPPPTATATPAPTPGGDCCNEHGGPSCNDNSCKTCVCQIDPECCTNVWDATCASEASQECDSQCPCENTGDCCAAHDGIGCNDPTCKTCVCGIDADCCTEGLGWDTQCVSEANVECVVSCTCADTGSCCTGHFDTLGCNDRRCQSCVCAFDSDCCTQGWDMRCSDEAAHECAARCSECAPACAGDCDGNGTVVINELISCVGIALGNRAVSTCSACDPNGNGTVAINELILAVNAALQGC
jgi:hypothetical protein